MYQSLVLRRHSSLLAADVTFFPAFILSDVVSKETYTFEDRGENITLRPEAIQV